MNPQTAAVLLCPPVAVCVNYNLCFHRQQDQNTYPPAPHGPGPTNAMATLQGGSTMATPTGSNAMTGNHGNASYLSNQAAVAAALKQQQQQQSVAHLTWREHVAFRGACAVPTFHAPRHNFIWFLPGLLPRDRDM